jgi:hypothetical protein
MYVVRGEFAEGDDLVDLGDGDGSGAGHGFVECAGTSEDEVTVAVGLVGTDEGEIRVEGGFEDVGDAIKVARLFAVGDGGAGTDGSVEGGDTGAGGTDAFGERALALELQLDLASREALLEGVDEVAAGADGKAGDALLDATEFGEQADIPEIGRAQFLGKPRSLEVSTGGASPHGSRDGGEVGDAEAGDGGDEVGGAIPGGDEAAEVDRRLGGDIGDGFVEGGDLLVDQGGAPRSVARTKVVSDGIMPCRGKSGCMGTVLGAGGRIARENEGT